MQIVATDLDGRTREFVTDYDELRITPRLCGYASVKLSKVDALSPAANQLIVAERALKVFDDDVQALRFFGKVWEPLDRSPDGVDVEARDPYAELAWRRVRDPTTATYAATDFGDIMIARVGVQNAIRNTYLRATTGNRQVSANTTRSWNAGKREDEIFDELATADGGPFFRVLPVDAVPGVMGDLKVLYPNAGATREGVRFAYGEGTLDNCTDYRITYGLPLNRFVAASSDADGGRIVQAYEDAASIARYGLFEDETTYSETVTTGLLSSQAKAVVRTDPAYTIALTPGLDAPLLYRDFDVGDFVRVRILYGADDIWTWARVVEATLVIDREGAQRLDSLVVDVLSGATVVTTTPEDLFRSRLDEERRRLEALERRVQLLGVSAGALTNQGSTAPAAPGGSSTDPSGDPPPAPPAPPPPPPPAPPDPPTVSGLSAYGINTREIIVEFDADGHGVYTEASVWAEQAGTVRQMRTVVVGSGSGHFSASLSPLARNTSFGIHVRVFSSAGANQADGSASTLNIDPV